MKSMIKILAFTIIIILTLTLYAAEDIFKPKTTIGGYGELHFNYKNSDGSDPSSILDFHRFVVFLSHTFSENWSFKAEVELEHNLVKNGQGELELEQAYINYNGSDLFNFQVGVLLPSVGLINDKHEPPLFLSVERPDYAKYIIPTTWFGNGMAVYGEMSGFNYKFTLMEGLDGDKISHGSAIRSARQKGFKADVESPLFNLRVDYKGIPGLLVGASYSHTQPDSEEQGEIPLNISELHAKYTKHNITAVFEIGRISYSEGDLKASSGFYFDLGYNISNILKIKCAVYPWFRWTQYNTASETRDDTPAGTYKVSKWLSGITVKPLNSIVFKIEYGIETRGIDDLRTRVFNLGAGYMF